MSCAQAESVIKSIIREIGQECAVKGHAVPETLVAFMVKAVVLDPQNEFNVDRALTEEDVRKLVELCVERLTDHSSPALDTIKMQVYFDMNYTSRREFLEEHHHSLQAKLSQVSREITDRRVKTRDEVESLYRKIISYVLLHLGTASHNDNSTARETRAALQSVFPMSELGGFMSLEKKDKEDQLNELTKIVTGICLFNKFSRKGGEGIDDLPKILDDALAATKKDTEYQLNKSQSLAWQYTTLLERLMDGIQPVEGNVSLDLLKQALYNVRQHEVFLNLILADLNACAEQVVCLQKELSSRMRLLRNCVHSKTRIPTAQVFPHFTALAKFWSGLQDERVLVHLIDSMVVSLQNFVVAQSQIFSEGQLDDLLKGSEVKDDKQRMESSDNCIGPLEFETDKWLLPETTPNFDKLPLEYKGNCGYSLVNKDGLLLPGNPSIGVLKHKEKFYVFCSKEAALSFASYPDEFIDKVAERAKRSPELMALLELHRQFASVSPHSGSESFPGKPATKCDGGTQTDTHLVETNIDKSYEWNEWELRRKAIKLANLRTKVTRSMQTHLSHMRRENSSQVYLPKDASCQTKKDNQTNTPKP